MKAILSKDGLKKIASLQIGRTLYAFDFDGTLSPIVSRPDSARATAKTEKLLAQLSKLADVAIISGRSVSDLKKRVPIKLAYWIGNHGLEGLPDSHEHMAKAKKSCATWTKSLREIWPELEKFPGVLLEEKTYSLSIHYRETQQKAKALRAINAAIKRLKPKPRIVGGKFVLNLTPKDGLHKGSAVQELMQVAEATHAVFVGDDLTDEDVFALKSKDIVPIRVGRSSSSKAKYYIPKQSDINHLLKEMISAHQSKHK